MKQEEIKIILDSIMLTKNDLQAIQEIVGTTVDAKLDEKLEPIKKDIKKIKKDTGVLIDYFDRKDVQLQKRIMKIEKHLSLVAA